jgi:cytochrome c biogenesis protein CcdA
MKEGNTMGLKGIDLLRVGLVLIFGGISIWLAITLLDGATRWPILIGGFVIGLIGTELYYVPRLREKWAHIGIPGYEKTEEQLKAAEIDKKRSNQRMVWIVIIGLAASALWRAYLPVQLQNAALVALWGAILASLSRIMWLIYQEGRKTRRNQLNG